ncbi:MAG: hypothetical protein A2284_02390 [Deltaproteobacteria bacterium RIFOXYA12_FULL_61_11]|nr:MAG: hypothetical protein A2284_02390 [Deltaproteobacteria bacterium RIFOXYA12_FULL_61_11]
MKATALGSKLLRQRSLVLLVLSGLVLLTKAPYLQKPYWWSEKAYLDGALAIVANGLNPFVEFWSYKPQLLLWLAALGFELGAGTLWWPRLLIALAAILALFATYELGRLLAGPGTGFLAALVVFAMPPFFVHAESFVEAVPFTATVLWLLLALTWGSDRWTVVFGSLLVLQKEPAVLLVAGLAGVELWFDLRSGLPRGRCLRRQLLLLSPLGVFVLWLALNHLVFGWFLWPHNLSFLAHPTLTGWGLWWIVRRVFVDDYRFLLSGLVVLGLLLPTVRTGILSGRLSARVLVLLLLSVLFHWLQCDERPFGDKDYQPLLRYYLYLLPLLAVYALFALRSVLPSRGLRSLGVVALLALETSAWSPTVVRTNGEDDLNQRHMVQAQRTMAALVELEHPGALIVVDGFTAWNEVLNNPAMGFVTERQRTIVSGEVHRRLRDGDLDELCAEPTILFFVTSWAVPALESDPRPLDLVAQAEKEASLGRATLLHRHREGPELVELYHWLPPCTLPYDSREPGHAP